MLYNLLIPIAGFLVGYVFVMLGVSIIRDANARRRKAELRRARLERDWKEGRFDA